MSKKFKKIILIFAAFFMVAVLLVNWLIKSGQAGRSKNQIENFSDYYKRLLAKCDKKDGKSYNCCLKTVESMASNNYQLASGLGCPPGFKINTFNCPGSYKWCELIR
ncbi:MAG: hypothetical protein Q7R92_01690 [bacterium]|nr:hypothetical protein [bacterium]